MSKIETTETILVKNIITFMDTADFELGEIIRKDFLSLEPNPN
jgi:hypothetical protein